MQRFRWTKARVAGAVGGVVLAGSTLALGGLASAQSPSPSPTPSSSPSPAASPSPGSRWPGRPPGGMEVGRGEFARRLAEALGIPQSRVEDALQQLRDRAGAGAQDVPAQSGRLADAAGKLGVTEQQLSDALRNAMGTIRDSASDRMRSGQGWQGPGDAFFSAVAQQLGGGITAEQVRDALGGGFQRQGMPDRAQLQARADQFLQEFASLLGVSVDQLREALRSIGGGMMHGPRGR